MSPISIKNTHAFTMIELLMVIMIVAVLGSVALPQFLDFRKEARAAVVREHLRTMRSAIKNQIAQIRLRCQNLGSGQSFNSGGVPSSFYTQITNNDVTFNSGDAAGRICLPSEVPVAAERKFWDVNESSKARTYLGYVSGGTSGGDLTFSSEAVSELPSNPLVMDYASTISGVDRIEAIRHVPNSDITPFGGPCGYIDDYGPSHDDPAHWVYVEDTGEIFPGSNTPGINECAF